MDFIESLESSSAAKSSGAETKSSNKSSSSRSAKQRGKEGSGGLVDEEDEADEGDDSQSFHVASSRSNEDFIMGKAGRSSAKSSASYSSISSSSNVNSSTIKLKQITKIISPKWPNRVFAFELIRRIIKLCGGIDDQNDTNEEANASKDDLDETSKKRIGEDENDDAIDINRLRRRAHFDLKLAKRLKARAALSQQPRNQSDQSQQQQQQQQDDYLILFLQDLMRVACIGATSSCDPLKLVGLDLLNDLILAFAHVEEPNADFKGHLVLEQYQASLDTNFKKIFFYFYCFYQII